MQPKGEQFVRGVENSLISILLCISSTNLSLLLETFCVRHSIFRVIPPRENIKKGRNSGNLQRRSSESPDSRAISGDKLKVSANSLGAGLKYELSKVEGAFLILQPRRLHVLLLHELN